MVHASQVECRISWHLDIGAPVLLVARESTRGGQPVHAVTQPKLSVHAVGADDKGTSLLRRAVTMARVPEHSAAQRRHRDHPST